MVENDFGTCLTCEAAANVAVAMNLEGLKTCYLIADTPDALKKTTMVWFNPR